MTRSEIDTLGEYLRSRRAKLDPAALGFLGGRRRTPGLRREEVALRASISTAWYTWLEQGRGGAPSAEVLDRLAHALLLTDIEREHLFLLGLGRPPGTHYPAEHTVSPRIQRLLDALPYSPATVKTATWEVLAWNRAAALLLHDYDQLPPGQRNVLRLLFCDPQVRTTQSDWESIARSVVAAFRVDAVRAGAEAEVMPLVSELCARSPEFEAMWRGNDVRASGGLIKRIYHPALGDIALEFSTLAIDGQTDLAMVVWNPATTHDQQAIQALVQAAKSAQ